jgi:hypothetical protein
MSAPEQLIEYFPDRHWPQSRAPILKRQIAASVSR